jgi:membrane protease YdiL (CAAX protease family)
MFVSLPLLYDRAWLRLSWREILRKMMPERRQLRRLLLTLLIGAAGIAAVNLLAEPICRLLGLSGVIRQIVSQTKTNQGFLEIVLLYIPLVNALGEEIFFRYGLFMGITDLGHERTAMLFSASLFSLYHLSIIASWISFPLLLASLAGLFIAGLFLNHIASRDRHILGIYLIHGLVNFLIISLSLQFLP